jgi:hypothetical protein
VVLSAVDQLARIEEIVQLTTVDLVERDVQAEVRIVLQEVANVEGGQQVQAWI